MLEAFKKEMETSKAGWQLVLYGGAVHGFTNPMNGDNPEKGVAYNKTADERSWAAMQNFFSEVFK